MGEKTRLAFTTALAVVFLLSVFSPFTFGQSESGKSEETFWDGALTFINQAAEQLGKWMVEAVNKIVGRDVANGLQIPLGYLGVLTVALAAFSAVEMARKVIWIIVVAGWGLLIVRIVLEVLSKPVST